MNLATDQGVVAEIPYFGTHDIVHSTERADLETSTLGEPRVGNLAQVTEAVGDDERYDIGEEIARGGHALVLRAIDRRLRRPVAIKQLRRDRATSQHRFVNEAFITARMQHPLIIPIFDIGSWADGTPYFAMKLVEGQTLSSRIRSASCRRQRLELLPIVIDVCDAVAYAHGQRIIHRDLKPANVLHSDFGETFLIDWGIAKVLDDESTQPLTKALVLAQARTRKGSVIGTPGYMAPEQAAGEDVDERTDVYALGCMLYHVIVGQAPFAAMSAAEMIARVREGAPIDLALEAPDVSAELVHIVERAMAHEAIDRYASAAELRGALRRCDAGSDLDYSQAG